MAYRKFRVGDRARVVALVAVLGMGASSGTAAAQTLATTEGADAESPSKRLDSVIVTANKRAQSVNSVGMSITAASGDQLLKKGVVDTADLVRVVPGFAYTQSPFSTPVYTLRGVGLYDYGLGSSPSVAVYVDEVPLVSTSMGAGATLDLERVEVLKGPQGTLFGQSSTGGAINYIAAKPTDKFETGGNLTYDRFGKMDTTGYLSGPLSDTLKARVAVRAVEGGDWQKSITRPDDTLGAQRLLVGRLLLDWQATDKLTINLNLNANRDEGDTVAPQLVSHNYAFVDAPISGNPYAVVDPVQFAALTDPNSEAYDASYLPRQSVVFGRALAGDPAVIASLTQPTEPGNSSSGSVARQAEWNPADSPRRDDSFYQAALRGEYEVADSITLTSITALARQEVDRYTEFDGIPVNLTDNVLTGSVESFSQELRLDGEQGPLVWLIGVSYDDVETEDRVAYDIRNTSISDLGGGALIRSLQTILDIRAQTYSAFANAEYSLTDRLTLQAGVRYNESDRTGYECAVDTSAEQELSAAFGAPPGTCYPLLPTFVPSVEPFKVVLNENNIPWRVGATYETDRGALLYGNVSTGYKAGIITGFAPSVTDSYAPAKQERLVAYEVGVKAPFFDRRLQFNAAAFQYDYTDKQIRTRILDATFGLLEKAANVPESRIMGIEAGINARPLEGLSLSLTGTYLDSEVGLPPRKWSII